MAAIPASGPAGPTPAGEGSARARYALATAITVLAILSQYVVPQALPWTRPVYGSVAGAFGVVYGVPIVAFGLLVGGAPLRAFASRMGRAAWEGLRWYGLLSLLALAVGIALIIVYTVLDPSALELLQRPNPALEQARDDPWAYVALSFLVGAVEELIFRGWIFGFWRNRPTTPWPVHAVWTSAVFAGVHLYYGQTYGAAAPIVFPTLFLLGFAFAATYQLSGGNLVVVALLHGANDATAFLSLVSAPASLALHYGIVLVGAVIGLLHVLGVAPGAARRPPPPPPTPGPPWGFVPAPWEAGPPAPSGGRPGPPPPSARSVSLLNGPGFGRRGRPGRTAPTSP
jgi:membrane protease YdiL (CAAX protease family)